MSTPASSSPSTPDLEARFRHDLLTPVNHILGFSTLLLDAAQGRVDLDCLFGIKSIYEEGRRVLEVIEEALPPAPKPDFRPDYPRLADRLALPADAITRGCDELVASPVGHPDLDQAEFLDDLSRIRQASQRLLDMVRKGPIMLSAS